jgi:hypothetical protein
VIVDITKGMSKAGEYLRLLRVSICGRFLTLCLSLHQLVLALTLLACASAIYPEDHWTYSTKINTREELDALVQKETDSGKTLFIRWIASAG